MIVSIFLQVLLPVLVVVVCGYALRRSLTLDLRSLNRVSLYVLSPALIFTTIARLDVAGDEALRLTLVSVLFGVAMGGLTLACALPLRLSPVDLSALLLCTMFMNTGNFGLPTSRFAFGEEGLERALLFFIPQAIMGQVLAISIARAGHAGWRGSLSQITRTPHIYVVVAGLVVWAAGLRLEGRADLLGYLFQGAALLSEATLPFMLLLLGMQLAQGVAVEDPPLTALATALRLLAAPLLAYGLARLLQLDDLSLRVAVFQASMPTAVNMVLYSLEFDTRPRFVAGVVVTTTALCLVTLTLLLALLLPSQPLT